MKKRVRIEATIFVERDSQKGIVIGKGGKNLKKSVKELDVILKCFSDRLPRIMGKSSERLEK